MKYVNQTGKQWAVVIIPKMNYQIAEEFAFKLAKEGLSICLIGPDY